MSTRSYEPRAAELSKKKEKPEGAAVVRFSALPSDDVEIETIPDQKYDEEDAVLTDEKTVDASPESASSVNGKQEDPRISNAPPEDFDTEEDDHPSDGLCGIGLWTPKWIQPFASPRVYIIITSILGILQGAYFTYFVGVLTTLEKRFSFESKLTGIILLADNLSPILISILLGYYGKKFHRPRLVGIGILFVVFSCFLATIPYYKYGPGTHLLTKTVTKPKYEFCDGEVEKEQCSNTKKAAAETHTAVITLFIANFLNGVGSCAFYTLGTPYLDDNVKKKNTAMYFATMYSLRVIGPTLGFLVASFSLSFYENPLYNPGITKSDPRWIGAWWMGFLILGGCILIFSIPLFLFPRKMPRKRNSQRKVIASARPQQLPNIKDLPKALLRLIKNPLVVCNTLSAIFVINGYFGYITFMPKYMETQFRISPTTSNLLVGSTGILATVIGIMLGGIFISRLRPGPRLLTRLLVIVEFAPLASYFVAMFLECPELEFTGTTMKKKGLDLVNVCNEHCNCSTDIFQPVCGPNGESNYFSPCYAGCYSEPGFNNTKEISVFRSCACVHDTVMNFVYAEARSGYCSSKCELLLPYILVLSIGKLIAASSRVGSMLVTLRSVDPEDKGLALGSLVAMACAFAFIPCPLIFGALTDAACAVWRTSCGKRGNCWLYDSDKLRYYLHGGAIIFIGIGDLIYIGIYLFSGRLRSLYEDDDEAAEDGYRKVTSKVRSEDLDDITYVQPMHKSIDGSRGDLTVI